VDDDLKSRIEALEQKFKRRNQEYFNAEDVASNYPFPSAAAVRTLASRRKIPFRKVGGRLIFLRSELDAWIKTSAGLTFDDFKKKEKRR
jgi:hypothetical protein